MNSSNFYPSVNHDLNDLTLPLIANWHFGKTRNWYLHFGPYFGVLLSAIDVPGNINVKSTYNNTDVGIDLGIGVNFPLSGTTNLFVEADGQGRATNIFKGTTDMSSAQNSRSSLNFGINVAIE